MLMREKIKSSEGTSLGHLCIETPPGVQAIRFVDSKDGSPDSWVEVNMGQPGIAAETEVAQVGGQSVVFHRVNMGNPHAVIFLRDFKERPPQEWGPRLEVHELFPDRTNVEFARPDGVHRIETRVWERGAGLTLACGSGACATAAAGILQKRSASPVEIVLPGGTLEIRWEGPGTDLYMTGPAQKDFEGHFEID